MSIISKLKGDKKKAADQGKEGGADKQAAAEQKRPTIKRNWTAEDMRQINRVTSPALSRANSSRSLASSRPRLSRSSTSLSPEWARPTSWKSQGKTVSFQGLARVVEDGKGDIQYEMPYMPAMPARYSSSSSLASSSRPRLARAPYSSGSSIGKSPLSSAETTPMDSEDSSSASGQSEDVLEIRSHPFSHMEQFVFHKSRDGDVSGKGKSPMYPINSSLDEEKTHNTKRVQGTTPQAERKYFTRATPTGTPASELPGDTANAPAAGTTMKEATESVSNPPKQPRFSFLKKKEDKAAAVH